MENLDLLYACFSQFAFSQAKENIRDLKYYFETSPATAGNPLVSELLRAIETYDLESIGLPLFQGILLKTSKTDEERREIIGKIIEYKKYTKEQMQPIKKLINEVVATVYLQKANRLYSDSPTEYINFLKSTNFKSTERDYLNSTNFKDIDMNTIIADGDKGILTSSFEFINSSFTEGGYKPGDIVVVSCCPGSGKSLIAETEALHMAINEKVPVNMLVMGDLDMSSLVLRLAAIYTGLPFGQAKMHLNEIYNEMAKYIEDRLDIIIVPAGVITATDYVEYILNSPKRYKAVFIDYDSNFKSAGGDGDNSLYLEYGDIYNEITKLKDAGIVSFVLCQPKQAYWTEPSIPLNGLGESSRKGHFGDFVLTRGKDIVSPNGLGLFKVAKNRHGRADFDVPSVRLKNGRFKALPRPLYNDLRNIQEEATWSEGEIDKLVDDFMKSKRDIQNQISEQTGTGKLQRISTNPNNRPF